MKKSAFVKMVSEILGQVGHCTYAYNKETGTLACAGNGWAIKNVNGSNEDSSYITSFEGEEGFEVAKIYNRYYLANVRVK